MSPALKGRFLTPEHQGSPQCRNFLSKQEYSSPLEFSLLHERLHLGMIFHLHCQLI